MRNHRQNPKQTLFTLIAQIGAATAVVAAALMAAPAHAAETLPRATLYGTPQDKKVNFEAQVKYTDQFLQGLFR